MVSPKPGKSVAGILVPIITLIFLVIVFSFVVFVIIEPTYKEKVLEMAWIHLGHEPTKEEIKEFSEVAIIEFDNTGLMTKFVRTVTRGFGLSYQTRQPVKGT